MAWRSLWRAPNYAMGASILVAIGVGAVATVFAVADAILLRPVRYPDPSRLYFLSTQHQPDGANFPPSVSDFQDYERLTSTFDALGITLLGSIVLPAATGAASHRVAYASSGLLRTLSVEPSMGRGLAASDDEPGAPPVIVLSHESWMQLFAGDSTIVGRSLTTSTGTLTVIGVLPPATMFPGHAIGLSGIRPFLAQNPSVARRDARTGTLAVARLAHGASLAAARSELMSISQRLAEAHPTTNANWQGSLESLSFVMADRFHSPTVLLFAGAVLVLIVASTNVAVLSLVRSNSRAGEAALRRALGAGATATLMPRLLELGLLVVLGSAVGLGLAKWALSVVATRLTSIVPRVGLAELDGRAVLIAGAAALLVLILPLFALLPQARITNLVQRLRSGSGAAARGRRFAAQNVLVVSQIALSLVLAVAGLSIITASRAALREGPGFDAARVISFPVEPSGTRYGSSAAQQGLVRRLRETLLALPGVESVGQINHAPLTQAGVLTPVQVAGSGSTNPGADMAVFRAVDQHYFAAAGQRVVEGRGFELAEMSEGSRSVVVNESFARKFWPGTSAVGQNARIFDQSPAGGRFNAPLDVRVIGIVADVKDWGFSRPTLPAVYVPIIASPWPTTAFAIRTKVPARNMLGTVRQAFGKIDPLLPVSGARTGDDLVAESEAARRAAMWIVVAFGVTAVLLACFGIYAVISQQVIRRARETGVRIACGATSRRIVGGFVTLALVLAGVGVVLGLSLTPALKGLLAWATPTAVRVSWSAALVAVLGLVAAVAFAALFAARRATRVHPVQLLRAD